MDYMVEIQIETESIDLKELLGGAENSFDFIYEKSKRVSMGSKDLIEAFTEKEVDKDLDNMFRYFTCSEWGEASGNYLLRYLIIRDSGDYVFVPLKMVNPIGKNKKYFMITSDVVSLYDRDVSNTLECLSKHKCIRYILVKGASIDDCDSNNYYNTPERFNYMDKGSWKSKKGINKLSNLLDVNCSGEEIFGIKEKISEMVDMWNEFKNPKVSGRVDIRLIEQAKSSNDIQVITFSYKGKILGVVIGILSFGKVMSIEVVKSLSICSEEYLKGYLEGDGVTDEEIHDIRKYMGSYIQYIIHRVGFKEKNLKAIYYDGDMGIKELREFKTLYYKKCIMWKKTNMFCGE